MTTLVGTQSHFSDALKELVELDYNAIEAYETIINRVKDSNYKIKLQKFKEDHEGHVEQLNKILLKHNQEIVKGPSVKQWLTKGKVVVSNLIGDDLMLKAMLTNEEDTNTAYERVNKHPEIWDDAVKALQKGLDDEKRHKAWLEETVSK